MLITLVGHVWDVSEYSNIRIFQCSELFSMKHVMLYTLQGLPFYSQC